MSVAEHRLALPAGYELGKYRFREVLGSGGFGITYLAEDRMLSRRVAVKELLPNDIATRVDGTTVAAKTKAEEESLEWARDRFVNEGRALAACDHPNVVRVYEMVEANGTAYMVTKYEEGRSLEQWLKELGRAPDEIELRRILLPLLSGLETVHSAGFLHRDIKPENIYLTSDGRPVLLDFGSARQAISNRSMAMTSIVTSGYAPFEQYYEDGNQGAWSDIYALGAVMYRAIVGKKPPEAMRRLKDDPCEKLAVHYARQYSAGFLRAIDKALCVSETRRPQSVAEWREMLGGGEAPEAMKMASSRAWADQEGFELVKEIFKTRPWLGPACGAALILIATAIWAMSRPKTNLEAGGHKIAAASPAASATAAPGIQPGVSPSPGEIAQASVTPAPMVIPEAQPTPQATVAPEMTPGTESSPAATPGASVAAAMVDPQLVGSWQTGSTRAKRTRWDIWADGHWIRSGLANDTGTLTATGGRIQLFSNTTQQTLDTAYELQDDRLVTHDQSGTANWRHASTGNASSSSTSTKHHPSGTNSTSHESEKERAGRAIISHFFGHGFP